jgi:hypothetical protein
MSMAIASAARARERRQSRNEVDRLLLRLLCMSGFSALTLSAARRAVQRRHSLEFE